MTKPLPVGIFNWENEISMEILSNSVANFKPDSNIGETFVADTTFGGYDDPKKKMYNEILPCVFEPKSKVPVSNRSAYQLLSTMRTGKRGDILKLS